MHRGRLVARRGSGSVVEPRGLGQKRQITSVCGHLAPPKACRRAPRSAARETRRVLLCAALPHAFEGELPLRAIPMMAIRAAGSSPCAALGHGGQLVGPALVRAVAIGLRLGARVHILAYNPITLVFAVQESASNKKGPFRDLSFLMVRVKGLEPSWGYPHTDLNRTRLPIPPHPRASLLCFLCNRQGCMLRAFCYGCNTFF